MNLKAVTPSLGIIAQVILSFPLCTGRPHVHGHSHDGRVRHAVGNYTAGSGSSLSSRPATATWGERSNFRALLLRPAIDACKIYPKIHLV